MTPPDSIPPHTLTAWLHITNRCNLSCAYCYAARGEQNMDQTTALAAVEALFHSAARHHFGAVKLKYAGGEPTLNLPVVQASHACAAATAQRYGLQLRESLLTNGVDLSEATLTALRDMGIRLAISLDGIGQAHDALRGPGTFARVASSIDRALALNLQPHISVTVTAQNADHLAEVSAYLLERDLTFNLNFYREPACARPGDRLTAEADRLIEGVRAALACVEQRLPGRNVAAGLLDRASLGYPHTRPCGVGQSYVAIDHQGRLARCHMELDQTVGDIWEHDPVTAIRSADGAWRNREVDSRQGCRVCRWRYWCAGGCPLLTYRLTGRDDLPSPYCPVYRALFPDLLRLEGLCLLNCDPPLA